MPEHLIAFTVYNRRLFSAQVEYDEHTGKVKPLTDSSAFAHTTTPADIILTPEAALDAAIEGERIQREKLAHQLTDYCTSKGIALDDPFYVFWAQTLEATVQLRMLELNKAAILADCKNLEPVELNEP